MCVDCHARAARSCQLSLNVLTLMRDCAIDDGHTPGPMLLAEIALAHTAKVEHEQKMLPYHLTREGEIVRPTAL